jgi:hypothetical protein
VILYLVTKNLCTYPMSAPRQRTVELLVSTHSKARLTSFTEFQIATAKKSYNPALLGRFLSDDQELDFDMPANGTVNPLDTISPHKRPIPILKQNRKVEYTYARSLPSASTPNRVKNRSGFALRDNGPHHHTSSSGEFRSTTISLRDPETAAFQRYTGSSQGPEKRKMKFVEGQFTVSQNTKETKFRFVNNLNQVPKSMETTSPEPDPSYLVAGNIVGSRKDSEMQPAYPEETSFSTTAIEEWMNIDNDGNPISLS